MKQLKLLGLALIAVLSLSILASAGTAQATVLCTTEDTSECTMSYPEGTAISLSLKSGTSMRLESTGGALEDTCSGGTGKGTVGAETGGIATIEFTELSWSGCIKPTKTLTGVFAFEIKHIEGTHNGTVIGKGGEWTMEATSGVSCVYSFGAGTTLGTLTGGTEPVLDINAIVNKKSGSFLCPADSPLEAEFVVTEPHALYVDRESAGQATVLCTTEDTSECTMPYSKGTTVDLSLKSGTSMVFKNTNGSLEDTCSGATAKGKTGAEAGSSVPVELSEWSWSGCSKTADTLAAGSLEIKRIEGTHNGTVTGNVTEWTIEAVSGVSCIYSFGAGTDLGTLTGGAEPVLKVNIVLKKKGGSFLCPEDSRLEAEFVVTEPHALYVI